MFFFNKKKKLCIGREEIATHTLTVGVKDRLSPVLTDYARLLVTVLDHNDHAPLFATAQYNVTVDDTTAVGAEIAVLTALDRDQGDNGRLVYSIVSGEGEGIVY